MDWILELPPGKESAWLQYWNELIGEKSKGTGGGILVNPEKSVRGDYAGAPTTRRFIDDYNNFIESYPESEPVRRLKLEPVKKPEDLDSIGKRIIKTVRETRRKKERLKPFIAGLQSVTYTPEGYRWDELHEILMRFFFAKFSEDNHYPITEWG